MKDEKIKGGHALEMRVRKVDHFYQHMVPIIQQNTTNYIVLTIYFCPFSTVYVICRIPACQLACAAFYT